MIKREVLPDGRVKLILKDPASVVFRNPAGPAPATGLGTELIKTPD